MKSIFLYLLRYGVMYLLICSGAHAQTVDSLTLNQAIQQMMQNHPLIDQAKHQVQASEARLQQSRSFFYPRIDAIGLYSYLGPVPTLSIPDVGKFSLFPENNYDIHVEARQTVFDFGRLSDENELARAQRNFTEDNTERIKSRLAFQMARTFYVILFLHENICLLDEEILALDTHHSIAEKKLETGSATEFDVLTIQVRLANAQSEKVEVESALQKQMIAMKRLLGVPLDQEIHLRGNFNLPSGGINPDSLMSVALSQRPEMILARDNETSLEIQDHLASLGNKPSLMARISLGLKNGYIPNLNQAKINWMAGVQMQMPIFDGFNTRYKSEESQANLEAARAYSRDVTQQISSEVQQALEDIRAKQEKIRTTELQLVQAEQALSLARTQYEVGVITNLDLLVAQTSQHEANLQHTRALYEMIMSRFILQETIGQKIW